MDENIRERGRTAVFFLFILALAIACPVYLAYLDGQKEWRCTAGTHVETIQVPKRTLVIHVPVWNEQSLRWTFISQERTYPAHEETRIVCNADLELL